MLWLDRCMGAVEVMGMQWRRWVMVAMVLLLSTPVVVQARERCFVETGRCIREPFLSYWEANGGLAVFGMPMSDVIPNEIVEGSWVGATQWFERDRLEDHGAQGIMAGRLGAAQLAQQGRPWQYGPGWPGNADCAYFVETGYTVCGKFLMYWRTNGGLARFGYPITTELTETIEGWTGQVQYFERRRMELHPELAGTKYEVLLGRLAADQWQSAPPIRCTPQWSDDADIRTLAAQVPFVERLGCASGAVTVPAAMQTFAGGRMIWLGERTSGATQDRIVVSYTSTVEPNQPTVYAQFGDDWQAGVDPEVYVNAQSYGWPHQYDVKRGFGKVWYRNFRRGPIVFLPALTPEQGQTAIVQSFSSGAFIIKLLEYRLVYAFGPLRTDVAGSMPGR